MQNLKMWPQTISITLSLAGVLTVASVSRSAACPAGQYSWMGTCMPEIGGTVGQLLSN
jgi:hypothetical protein